MTVLMTPPVPGIIILASSPLHLVLHSHAHLPMINQLLYVLVVFACTSLEHLFACLSVTSSRKKKFSFFKKNMYAFFWVSVNHEHVVPVEAIEDSRVSETGVRDLCECWVLY